MNLIFMFKYQIRVVLVVLWVGFLMDCTNKEPIEPSAEDCAKEFGEHFFNFRYRKASELLEVGTEDWMQSYLSNISKKDIENIQQLGLVPEIETRCLQSTDSLSVVMLKIKDAYLMDSIGKEGRLYPDYRMQVKLVHTSKGWRVRRADLQRSEE